MYLYPVPSPVKEFKPYKRYSLSLADTQIDGSTLIRGEVSMVDTPQQFYFYQSQTSNIGLNKLWIIVFKSCYQQ